MKTSLCLGMLKITFLKNSGGQLYEAFFKGNSYFTLFISSKVRGYRVSTSTRVHSKFHFVLLRKFFHLVCMRMNHLEEFPGRNVLLLSVLRTDAIDASVERIKTLPN